jgi:hypothetical protein
VAPFRFSLRRLARFSPRVSAILLLTVAVFAATACHRHARSSDEQRSVNDAFEGCKKAILNRQVPQFMAYIPGNVYDYFGTLINAAPAAASAGAVAPHPADTCPGVDLLLRTALKRKVPPELRDHLTLDALVQNMVDRGLLSPREIGGMSLGRISVNGDRASAVLYYQGTLTALRVPFFKQGTAWKIDILALLPYAEVLMRVDRAITGQTEEEQVDQLVGRLPLL